VKVWGGKAQNKGEKVKTSFRKKVQKKKFFSWSLVWIGSGGLGEKKLKMVLAGWGSSSRAGSSKPRGGGEKGKEKRELWLKRRGGGTGGLEFVQQGEKREESVAGEKGRSGSPGSRNQRGGGSEKNEFERVRGNVKIKRNRKEPK